MPGSVTSEANRAIAGLCKSEAGRSAAELSAIMEIKRSSISWHLSELMKAGIVFRGGAGKDLRYFQNPEIAKEYTQEAEARLAKSKAATAEKIKAKAAERARENYAKKQKEKKAQEVAKPVRIDLAMRDSGLVIATKQQEIDHKRFHQQANVIWPDNVKVTIIPTGVDTRFMAFVEPGKGQISQDWAQRRKFENQRNSHGK